MSDYNSFIENKKISQTGNVKLTSKENILSLIVDENDNSVISDIALQGDELQCSVNTNLLHKAVALMTGDTVSLTFHEEIRMLECTDDNLTFVLAPMRS